MKFITVEQFLKADTKVQQAISEWWKPSVGDLIVNINDSNQYCVIDNFVEAINCCSLNSYNAINYTATKDEVIPLLTEGQLIDFIEDRLNGKIDIGYYAYNIYGYKGYAIGVWDDKPYRCIKEIEDLGTDLLQALWKMVNDIICDK